jgi:hypothetical protein
VVAGAVAAAGVVVTALLAVALYHALDKPIERFASGERIVVQTAAGDERTVYQQVGGPLPAGAGDAGEVTGADLECEIRGPAEELVPSEASSSFTLTINDKKYRAKRDWKADRGGRYTVACRSTAAPERRLGLAVGPRIRVLGFVASIVGALGALFGGLALGALIAGLTAVLRYQSRRRLEREAAAAPFTGP